jgi:hypothetical protein
MFAGMWASQRQSFFPGSRHHEALEAQDKEMLARKTLLSVARPEGKMMFSRILLKKNRLPGPP